MRLPCTGPPPPFTRPHQHRTRSRRKTHYPSSFPFASRRITHAPCAEYWRFAESAAAAAVARGAVLCASTHATRRAHQVSHHPRAIERRNTDKKNPTHRSRHPSTSRIDRRLGRPHPRGAAHDDPSIHPSIRIDVCIVCVVYPLARPRVGPSLASRAIIMSSSTHRRTYLVFAYIVVATCVVEK